MTTLTIVISVVFLLLSVLTFRVWLQPPGKTEKDLRASLAAASFGTLFFLASFSLGVWFSILRMRGELWLR